MKRLSVILLALACAAASAAALLLPIASPSLLEALGLPPRLSKKEMLEVFNRLYTFEQLDGLLAQLELL